MSRYPRWMRIHQHKKDLEKVQRIIDSVGEPEAIRSTTKLTRNTPGDTRVMRAIPVVADGVVGTVPGTDPLDHVIRNERCRPTRPLT